jgi:heptosyltransferase III
MKPIRLPSEPRVLVIAMRRLGDVLLTTPLIRSVKRAFPASSIDALVFAGTEGILAGNPDLTAVLTMPERSSLKELSTLLRRLWRRYDLALSTQTGDRPTTLAFVAGRQSAGPLEVSKFSATIKRLALSRSYPTDRAQHRIVDLSHFADLLGIPACNEIVCPQGHVRSDILPGKPYAVLHGAPKFRIRRWTEAGWRALARELANRGLNVAVTGGSSAMEKQYLDRIWRGLDPPVMRFDGVLRWPELTVLLRDAAVYIGPDTSMTHLAAGAGAPTVALYGPASPSLIGPWPIGGLQTPWARSGRIQHRGNVWLVQNPLPCMPCDKLGCEGHLESYSRCLDELSVHQVLAAVDEALATRPAIEAVANR